MYPLHLLSIYGIQMHDYTKPERLLNLCIADILNYYQIENMIPARSDLVHDFLKRKINCLM